MSLSYLYIVFTKNLWRIYMTYYRTMFYVSIS